MPQELLNDFRLRISKHLEIQSRSQKRLKWESSVQSLSWSYHFRSNCRKFTETRNSISSIMRAFLDLFIICLLYFVHDYASKFLPTIQTVRIKKLFYELFCNWEVWSRNLINPRISYFEVQPLFTTQRLLFIHQSNNQKRLLEKYSNEICFLGATYKATKYSIPLFFLALKSNVNYQILETFALRDETTIAISEAISILKT